MSIKTWRERCEEQHGDLEIVTHEMVQARMDEEIDDLRDEIDRLRAENEALDRLCAERFDEIAALGAENEALRGDAERFRFLLLNAPYSLSYLAAKKDTVTAGRELLESDVRDVIDSAMRPSGEPK